MFQNLFIKNTGLKKKKKKKVRDSSYLPTETNERKRFNCLTFVWFISLSGKIIIQYPETVKFKLTSFESLLRYHQLYKYHSYLIENYGSLKPPPTPTPVPLLLWSMFFSSVALITFCSITEFHLLYLLCVSLLSPFARIYISRGIDIILLFTDISQTPEIVPGTHQVFRRYLLK